MTNTNISVHEKKVSTLHRNPSEDLPLQHLQRAEEGLKLNFSWLNLHLLLDKQEDQSRERRKMKTLAVVLVLALAFSFGEALRCNRCISRGCSNRVETCSGPNDVCANVFFLPPAPINYFRRCMKASDCQLLSSLSSLVVARCCGTDLCN
ncbi:unnamed protein product [Boreogadus saida]